MFRSASHRVQSHNRRYLSGFAGLGAETFGIGTFTCDVGSTLLL
jgi:hypothetical protein